MSITTRSKYSKLRYGELIQVFHGNCEIIMDSIVSFLYNKQLLFPWPGIEYAITENIRKSNLCNYDSYSEYVCILDIDVSVSFLESPSRGLSHYNLAISCYDGFVLAEVLAKNKDIRDVISLEELNALYYMNMSYSINGGRIYTNFIEKFSDVYHPLYGDREIKEFREALKSVLKHINK